MEYRKFKSDLLFTGREMKSEAVLVTDKKGIVQGLIPANEAGDVENYPGILSPGFVNCHCHLELSHLKGLIPEKTGLVDFLLTVIKQRSFHPDSIRMSIANAENEMIRNGIVAVGDICNTADTLAQKSLGNLFYHNFIETLGFVENQADKRFEDSCNLFHQFARQNSFPANSNSIVPHAPYSVSKKLFEKIANFPGNQVLTIHNQEFEDENRFFLTGEGEISRLYQALGINIDSYRPSGKRSPANYLDYFHGNQSLILVHNVATSEEDLKTMRSWQKKMLNEDRKSDSENLYFCLCPNANQYISGRLPDIDMLVKHDAALVMGTDSLASNHQLDILEELKTLQQNFPQIETGTLMKWATLNGANALHLDTVIGSFDPGKQPGLLLIDQIVNGKFTPGSKVTKIL